MRSGKDKAKFWGRGRYWGPSSWKGSALSSHPNEVHFRRSRFRVGKDQSSALAEVTLRGPLELPRRVPRRQLEPQVRLPEGEGGSGNGGLESPEWSFSQARKGVVGLLMPVLEMRKLELRDVESRDHSHRAGPLGSRDLE